MGRSKTKGKKWKLNFVQLASNTSHCLVAYKSNQGLGAGVANNALNTNRKVFIKAVAGKGIKNMDNYSGPFLTLHRLCKDFYEATMQGEYARAYEISLDITEMAQKLEDFAKGLRDAYTD